MAIDPEAKVRWRERRIGDVAMRDFRGVVALLLIGLSLLMVVGNSAAALLLAFLEEPVEQELTADLLVVGLSFNALILVAMPVAALFISRPRRVLIIPAQSAPPLNVPPPPSLPSTPPARKPPAPRASVASPRPSPYGLGPATERFPPSTTMPSAAPVPPPEPASTATRVVRRLGLQVDRRTPVWILLGVGVAIGLLIALAAIFFTLDQLGVKLPEESPLIEEIGAFLNWPLVFFIATMAAVTEEVFFRGVLQPRIGIIASSALFGIIHASYGTVLQIVAPFVLGLVFGLLFQRTKSLWAPIAAHFAFDFIELSALLLAPS